MTKVGPFQMDGAAFISALGGALSLFLGISLSMIFEVFEFIIDLFLNTCVFICKKKKKTNSDDPTIMKPYSAGFDYKEPSSDQIEKSMEWQLQKDIYKKSDKIEWHLKSECVFWHWIKMI